MRLPIQRVAVVGPSGAGKSTLARALGPILNLPVIHLDTEHWLPNWTEPPRPQWEARVRELALRDRWIIDGNFGGSQEERFERADTIVLLDMPNWKCVWRVIKRLIKYHGRVRPDLADGCYEKWDWEFIEWVWNFNENDKPALHERVRRFTPGRNVFVLRDDGQSARFVESMRRVMESTNSLAGH